jgi:hypothetical protein
MKDLGGVSGKTILSNQIVQDLIGFMDFVNRTEDLRIRYNVQN